MDEEFHALLKRYKTTIDGCKRDKEAKQKELLEFKDKMDDLRAAYLFGLKRVSELKDLQDAPDAILFGNFPQNPKTTKKTGDRNDDIDDERAH